MGNVEQQIREVLTRTDVPLELGGTTVVDVDGNQIYDPVNTAITADQIFFGQLSSTPSNQTIPSGKTVLYFKDDNNLYKKPDGGSETLVGGGGSSNSAGDGLKESSGTFNIEPADFAGALLSDDGTDDLQVNTGTGVTEDGSDNLVVDEAAALTWTGTQTFNAGVTLGSDIDAASTYTINNLPTPTNPGEVATKSYADSIASGLELKQSVDAATDGTNIDLASTTDPNPIDGITLSNGDRVLLKDQSTASENGIYDASTATDPTTWTRSFDADEDSEVVSGTFTFVPQGTTNGNKSFIITTPDPITVGSTSITWSQFSGAGDITAGDGLKQSGDTFNIEPSDFAGNGLVDDGNDDLAIPSGGVGSNELDSNSVTDTEADLASLVVEDPQQPPISALDDTESVELPVRVNDGETLNVHRWGAYDVSDGSTPTDLDVQLLDNSDTIQNSANTGNAESKSTPVASLSNSSGSLSIYKVRAINNTGASINSPGVGAQFGYYVN